MNIKKETAAIPIHSTGGGNANLHKAKATKNDEFYTQFDDINAELQFYWQHFEGKTVYCNCDDPYESNFCKYFILNFNFLKLKRLITTSYVKSPIQNTELSLFDYEPESEKTTKNPHKIDITQVPEWVRNLDDVKKFIEQEKLVTKLKGNGSFDSPECVELLKQSDIVCTNPPHSLFRKYIDLLVKHDKKFLVIGNLNALKYKDIFPYIMNDEIWFGATCFTGGATYFIADKNKFDPNQMSSSKNAYLKDGQFYWRVNGVRWYTNLDHKKRHQKIDLVLPYNPEKYLKYDNYDAINVDKVTEIPCDYNGIMGVPISFMDKYSPDQFEIIGEFNHGCDSDFDLAVPSIKGKVYYTRIAIRRKQ